MKRSKAFLWSLLAAWCVAAEKCLRAQYLLRWNGRFSSFWQKGGKKKEQKKSIQPQNPMAISNVIKTRSCKTSAAARDYNYQFCGWRRLILLYGVRSMADLNPAGYEIRQSRRSRSESRSGLVERANLRVLKLYPRHTPVALRAFPGLRESGKNVTIWVSRL